MDYAIIKTFSDVLSLMEREYSERVAIRWVDDDEIPQQKTYHDFCTDIRRGIFSLHNAVSGTKGRVAFLARNSYDYAVMLFACLVAGIVAVPLNIQKSAKEILHELTDSDTDIVFHDGEFVEREGDFADLFRGRLLSLDNYAHFSDNAHWNAPSPLTLASIYYTSGTTARSKGVMLNQRNLLASTGFTKVNDYFKSISNVPEKHPVSWFILLPFFHLAEFGPLLSALIDGGVANVNRNTKYYLRDMKMLSSDVAIFTPVYLDMICKKLHRGGKSFLGGIKILCLCSAPVSADMLSFVKAHDIDVVQLYGLTEAFAPVVMNTS